MVQVGIVGCGAISTRRHIPELAANPKATLVAFCDPVSSRAEAQAKKHDGKAYADFESFLKHPNMDAVVLGTPNALHAAHALAALNAGKHVLVEKPMATSREDARAMIDAAKAAGKFLMVGQNQRLARPHQMARDILKSGRLGKVISFRTAFKHPGPEFWCIDAPSTNTWFFKKPMASMGVCGDLGIHKADLMRYLLGEEIVEVQANIETLAKTYDDGKQIDVDDNAMLMVKTASGVLGSIIISWTNYGEAEANYTIIYTEKAALMLAADPKFGVIVRHRTGEEECYRVGKLATNEEQTGSGVSQMFIEAITSNKPPEIDGVEGYKSLDVILTAFDAHRTGQRTKVAPFNA
jgi:predicted dehydrogenase